MKKEILKQNKDEKGYNVVNLIDENGKSKEFRVDYLVASSFVPNPHNYKNIRHIDGNLENNRADNLEWVE